MVKIIGGGLAGSEAAWQLAKRGIRVKIYEMKPKKFSLAHKLSGFAELVCSNSLKSNELTSSNGLLKAEMQKLDSLIVSCANQTRLAAGGALAVDVKEFSRLVTSTLLSHPLISFECDEVESLDEDAITILATGPLTEGKLAQDLAKKTEGFLYFYDASSPIITKDSLDFSRCFFGSRYNKGGDDYINCPLSFEEYDLFHSQLVQAERVVLKSFEKNVFEDCLPVEVLAQRGKDSLRFGCLKPVGFLDPVTQKRPYALVQLRQENREGTMYNIVGFQTNLKFGEQKRVFSLIPALKNAEFVRYGVMHRNSFVNAPKALDSHFRLKLAPNVFVAGQLSGVEGYVESAASGLIAGINAANIIAGRDLVLPPKVTMLGALLSFVAAQSPHTAQPISTNFGLLPELCTNIRDKKQKRAALAERALCGMDDFLVNLNT